MIRTIPIVTLCLWLAACNSSSDNPSDNSTDNKGLDLNPTTATLDTPPTDGKLPSDLLPPA